MNYLFLSITFMTFATGIVVAGLKPLSIIDIPSVLLVFGPSFAAGCMVGNAGTLGDAFKAFFSNRTDFTPEEKSLYARTFKAMGNTAAGSGVVGVIIGAVAMLQNLGTGDASAIGVGAAACLISTLYGWSFKAYFCIPAEERFRA